MKDGSGKWLPSKWATLLEKALIALDSLDGGAGHWTFGGDTALARALQHRIAYDVDILLDSSTALRNLAPNINPVTKSICNNWQWPGKHLKLEIKDVGEIVFLDAPSFIDDATYKFEFAGRTILIDRPAEILTKKLIYRASTFTVCDTYDLAAVYLYDRDALIEVAQCPLITQRVIDATVNRIALAKTLYQSEIRNVINPTSRGENFIDRACDIALEALREIQRYLPASGNAHGNGSI